MNFIEEYKKGQIGGNKGIPLGKGLNFVSNAINGLQRHRIIGVASPPKVGKSTFVNYAFLIQPYLYAVENNIDIHWIYYSFEIDRVSMEFDFAAYFLFHDYGITHISLGDKTKNGSNIIEISPDYLRGRIQDDNNEIIKVKPEIEEVLKEVYQNRITPIFGEYDKNGYQIKKGMVTVIEKKNNPTGIRNELLEYAKKNGDFVYKKYGQSERIIGYKPKNPKKFTVIITDHLRKLIPERNYNMKTNVDKFIEYSVELRNLCDFTFIHIIHTNRNITSQDRMRYAKDMLYPTAEDIKSTGNLSEDCDYLFTLFNPNDDRYKLNEHFGIKIKDPSGNELYPNMRTIHLVESRHTQYPQHFKVNMLGNIKNFEKLEI